MTEVISKERILRDARDAVRRGLSLADACPYPWGSDAANEFKAAYLCAPILDAWECAGLQLDGSEEGGLAP